MRETSARATLRNDSDILRPSSFLLVCLIRPLHTHDPTTRVSA